MAEYRGFTCDQCGNVFPSKDRTIYTQRFEGPTADSERTSDLCPDCFGKIEVDGLKPIRRRAKKDEKAAAS